MCLGGWCAPCSWRAWWWLPACLGARALVVGVLGGGYLHALELVYLVRALLVRVVRVLVGSGYLHTLNLVSLVRALVVRAGWCGYLHALELVPCWLLLVGC